MTIKQIKDGLHFTMDMFLFNPSTGEYKNKEQLNDMDRTTYDACEGAIKALEELHAHREAWEKVKKRLRDKHSDPYSMHCVESYFIGIYDAIKIVDEYRPKEGDNE